MKPHREHGGKWLTPLGKRQKRLLIKRERQARGRDAIREIVSETGASE